jgi:cystathionine gamma-synthase
MTLSGGFATRAIHAGQEPDPTTGAVVPPIYQASTFVQDGVNQLRGGYEYSRSGNPTRAVLETLLAALEDGVRALSFASGLAAEDALLRTVLTPSAHVVISSDAYGGTYRLLDRIHGAWGVRNTPVDLTDLAAARAALEVETDLLWVETPSNPLLKISDITALARLGHEAGAIVVVDNTFASPVLQRPLTLGADVVVHSTTKYLGGHSDVVGGALIFADDDLAERVAAIQFSAGAISSPMDAWLTVRGVKTLAVRLERHCANAQAVAEHLARHPAVETVYYPGLASHPGHALAARQMNGFGGMVSLALHGGERAARHLAESTRLFQLAESLGGVESLVCYPSEMTHAAVKGTPLAVAENVVRLSVGLEDIDDLLADLDEALA